MTRIRKPNHILVEEIRKSKICFLIASIVVVTIGCEAWIDVPDKVSSESNPQPSDEIIVPIDNVIEPNILPSAPAGWNEGEFSVSSTGNAEYRYPIWVPSGRAGMQPVIGLRYNSGGASGYQGVGWSLTGVKSRISRCRKSIARDGVSEKILFNSSDNFCLDGQKLVSIAGRYGADGTEYRTGRESYKKIISYGAMTNGSSSFTPREFVVWTKDGRIHNYSSVVQAKRLYPKGGKKITGLVSGKTVTVEWLRTRTADRTGNSITTEYEITEDPDDLSALEVYPIRMRYGPKRMISFRYEDRPDLIEKYKSGVHFRISKRLAKIKIYGPNSARRNRLLKEYQLRYINTSITRRSLVKGISECDGAGVCLPEILFEWELGDFDFDVIDTDIDDVFQGGYEFIETPKWRFEEIHTGDVNGDGRDDLLYPAHLGYEVDENEHKHYKWGWKIRLSRDGDPGSDRLFGRPYDANIGTGTMWDPFEGTDFQYEIVDYNRDGKIDVFTDYNFEQNAIYVSNGSDFSVLERFPGRFSENGKFYEVSETKLIDINGDGCTDRIHFWNFGSINPKSYTRHYKLGSCGSTVVQTYLDSGENSDVLVTADLDGDGRTEMISPKKDDYRYEAFGLDADGNIEHTRSNLYGKYGDRAEFSFVDVNGDGLQDALESYAVRINSGNGFGVRIREHMSCSETRTADFDGDGNNDILCLPELDSDENLKVYSYRNNRMEITDLGFKPGKGEYTLPHIGHSYYSKFKLLDVNGDGLIDIMKSDILDGKEVIRILRRKKSGRTDLITKIGIDGVGDRVGISYKSVGDRSVYTLNASCDYPLRPLTRGMTVVSSHKVPDARLDGRWNSYSYHYSNGLIDFSGRGFLGFATRKITNLQTGGTTTIRYTNHRNIDGRYPFALLPNNVTETKKTGIISKSTGKVRRKKKITYSDYDYNPIGTNRYEVKLKKRTIEEYDADVDSSSMGLPILSKTIDYSYDLYGNITQVVNNTNRGLHEITNLQYDNDESLWLINRISKKSVKSTAPSGIGATRTAEYQYYPGTNLIEWETIEPDIPELRSKLKVIRDDHGLPVEMVTTADVGGTRITKFGYDIDGIHVTSITDVTDDIEHVLSTKYHPGFGVPLLTTDENGIETAMRYDGFGRIREEIPEGGTRTHHLYLKGTSGPEPLIIRSYSDDGRQKQTYVNQLGEAAYERTVAFDGRSVYVHYGYDKYGRLISETHPHYYGEKQKKTTYTYDHFGRIRRLVAPGGATTEYDYVGLTYLEWDPKGNLRKKEMNADNNIAKSFEVGARLYNQYTYGPFGQLQQVIDAAGNVSEMEYDNRGRRTHLLEPNTGTTEYKYNGFGEVIEEIGHDGDVTGYIRDQLGRITSVESDSDGITEYKWDTSPNGIGKLAWSESPDKIKRNYYYDGLGRQSKVTYTVGSEIFSSSVSYDEHGRIRTLFYPEEPGRDRFSVNYKYTSRGYLEKVQNTDGSLTHWWAKNFTADGKIKDEYLGNRIRTERLYDPNTRRLGLVQSKLGGSFLYGVGYGYDVNGNVEDRIETYTDRRDHYQYDDQNRMIGWSVYEVDGIAEIKTYEKLFSYDVSGNLEEEEIIRGKGLDKIYRYGERGYGSHQLTSDSEGEIFDYDLLGRQIRSSTRTVQYNRHNLPASVAYKKETSLPITKPSTVTFGYDADAKRVLKKSPSETTLYFDGIYERRTKGRLNKHIYYIASADGNVAQVTRTEGAGPSSDETLYFHSDGQGSTGAISNASGEIVERFRYDPFGKRIDERNQPLSSISTDDFHLGFTGHEHDDDIGLINMKGRIYDPKQRRFLSMDPYVVNPSKSAGYNRYAYVSNNPATFIDPSGFNEESLGEQNEGVKELIPWEIILMEGERPLLPAWEYYYFDPDAWLTKWREDYYNSLERNQCANRTDFDYNETRQKVNIQEKEAAVAGQLFLEAVETGNGIVGGRLFDAAEAPPLRNIKPGVPGLNYEEPLARKMRIGYRLFGGLMKYGSKIPDIYQGGKAVHGMLTAKSKYDQVEQGTDAAFSIGQFLPGGQLLGFSQIIGNGIRNKTNSDDHLSNGLLKYFGSWGQPKTPFQKIRQQEIRFSSPGTFIFFMWLDD